MKSAESTIAEFQAKKRSLKRLGVLWSVPFLMAIVIGTIINYTEGDITDGAPWPLKILGIALLVVFGAALLRAQRVVGTNFKCPNCGHPPTKLESHELLLPWGLNKRLDISSCATCGARLK